MATIINETYFDKGNVKLPSNTYKSVTDDIERYEKEILQDVLGYSLWKAINAEIADFSSAPQRIKDLVLGVEYTVTVNNYVHTIKWNGLQNDDKISLIANYVFYWNQRNAVAKTANVGTVKAKQENSIVASPAQKMGAAWNDMNELVGYIGQKKLIPSLFNFLEENEDDYPELDFNPVGTVNMFGL